MLARLENGRFARGNAGGPGNPFAKKTARFKRILLDSVSDKDLQAITKKLVAQAKKGDLAATRLVLDRLVGKSTAEPLAGAADVELTEGELQAARLNQPECDTLDKRRAYLLELIGQRDSEPPRELSPAKGTV